MPTCGVIITFGIAHSGATGARRRVIVRTVVATGTATGGESWKANGAGCSGTWRW